MAGGRAGRRRGEGVGAAFPRLRSTGADADSGVELSNVQRHALADSAIEIGISRLLGYRVAWMQSKKLVPNYEASMGKVFGSELTQRNARRAINVLGLAGQLRPQSDHAVMNGLFCQLYMSSASSTMRSAHACVLSSICASVGFAAAPISSSGRLRPDEAIRVRTPPGQSTETYTCESSAASWG